MGEVDAARLALRIERGHAREEELAAVTVVLCSVLAGRGEKSDEERSPEVPLWRPGRAAAVYRSPYSWR
jgi:acyl-CoA carboxylase epsilon subunit-like protein